MCAQLKVYTVHSGIILKEFLQKVHFAINLVIQLIFFSYNCTCVARGYAYDFVLKKIGISLVYFSAKDWTQIQDENNRGNKRKIYLHAVVY